MNTKSPARAGVVAGLLLLAVVILMTVAPTAGAMRTAAGPTTGAVVSVSQTQLLLPSAKAVAQHEGVSGTASALQQQKAVTPQAPSRDRPGGFNRPSHFTGNGASTTAQAPTSSGTSSTTIWIAAVAVLGALLIGTWALVTRRRRQPEATPDCESTLAGC